VVSGSPRMWTSSCEVIPAEDSQTLFTTIPGALFVQKGDIVIKAEPFESIYCSIDGLEQFEMFKVNYTYSYKQNNKKITNTVTGFVAQEFLATPGQQSQSKRNQQKQGNQRKIFRTQKKTNKQPQSIV